MGYTTQYYQQNKEEIDRKNRLWAKENPERWKAIERRSSNKHSEKTRLTVLTHYSKGKPICANPFKEHKEPYMNILALSIDHINNDGAKHRKKLGITRGSGSQKFFRWLITNNFPKGFQVLCMNCQIIKEKLRVKKERKNNG